MAIPYALIKALNGESPYLDKRNRLPKTQAEFLMKPGNMKGKYLGACLDSCRWGSQTTVMYEMTIPGMINFIQEWMRQNEKIFRHIWHEKTIDEMYTRFELPHIYHDVCPRDRDNTHRKTIVDRKGIVRCANISSIKLKPNYIESYTSFDKLSGMMRTDYFDDPPVTRDIEDLRNEYGDTLELAKKASKKDKKRYEEDLISLEKEIEKAEAIWRTYEEEEEEIVGTDICYAILSDKVAILSLEEILKRLNLTPETKTVYCRNIHDFSQCKRLSELSESDLEFSERTGTCPGHEDPTRQIEFPFDGWDLAFYVQRWWEQMSDGKAPVFGRMFKK